ncbi:DUF1385 domain-containing protein [Candidatus Woesearchaeota archaeon]|nr:DUF1385 domain-containing protein [Candidatus Woesearchaeota archaeon]
MKAVRKKESKISDEIKDSKGSNLKKDSDSKSSDLLKCDMAAGGQALIEGVMMKGPKYITMAVRKPDGNISIKNERLKSNNNFLSKWVFFRGIFNLINMMVIGVKALSYSANESMGEEDEKLNPGEIFLSVFLALVFALFLFKLLPLGITMLMSQLSVSINTNSVIFNIIDGVIKVVIFISYVLIISMFPDIKRIFEYHGAEHKAVACYEAGKKLTVKNARPYSTRHSRCGTSFLMFVILLSIIVYTFLPSGLAFWQNYLYRILLLPVIAGISYEILKLSAKHTGNPVFKLLIWPGLMMQNLTTKEPDDEQLEVGVTALSSLLKAEGMKSV